MRKYLLVLFFLISNASSFAQSILDIAFGDSIYINRIEPSTEFKISSSYGEVIIIGAEINNYKFDKPGKYWIKVIQLKSKKVDERDNHLLPSELQVNVSAIKMIFLEEGLQFSKAIKKNIETSGIDLTIPIIVQTYDNKPVLWHVIPIKSAGIASSIVAIPQIDTIEINTGNYIVHYNLKGSVTENSFLSFDFVDVNHKIQSISLKSPIEN